MMSLSREKISGNQRGFTLIELMIVVALIGILTSIAFPLYANVQTRVRIAKAKADLRTLASAVSIYAAYAGVTPVNVNSLTATSTVNGKTIPVTMPRIPTLPNTTWSKYTLIPGAAKGAFTITTSSATDKASLKAP
jgi:type IV pilus assembly protein PilA